MRKRLLLLFVVLCALQTAALAGWPFKDVPLNHPAYDCLYNLANVYGIDLGYKDRTFRGEEEMTRFEFVIIYLDAVKYLEKISGRNLSRPRATPESFSDVSDQHWAYDYIDQADNRYQIISGYADGTWRGETALNRYELMAGLEKVVARFDDAGKRTWQALFESFGQKSRETVTRYEVAVAIDMLIQKMISELRLPLPAGARETFAYPNIPVTLDCKWGGVRESVSQTDNWGGWGVALGLEPQFRFLNRTAALSLKLGYDLNRLVYWGSTDYAVLQESRVQADLLFTFPLTSFFSLIVGGEYFALNNYFSPATFLGAAVGAKLRLQFLRLTPELLALSFNSLQPAQTVVSRYGEPRQKSYFELTQGLPFGQGRLQFLYAFEQFFLGNDRNSRVYNTFGLRYLVP